MKKYVLTSPRFAGNVTFWYNEDDILVYFHNEAEMNIQQHSWLLRHLPTQEDAIKPLSSVIEGTLELLPEDLSFDRFWNAYARKVNRARVEPMWKKMSDAEKLQAIMQIKPYERYLQRTGFRGKADPENYLRKGYFTTDWNKER